MSKARDIASAAPAPAGVTTTELGYVDGVTSAIQTQINQKPEFTAGKNKIINGDFSVNQRAFTSRTSNGFGFDRFENSWGDGAVTYSAQTFTPGTAPVAGYEATNFARIATASQTTTGAYSILQHKIEDVQNFAGQTATLSFWAKAGSGTPKIAFEIEQVFGSGGSPSGAAQTYAGQATLSTSWARYSITVSVPSISGKTIGTTANSSYLLLNFWLSSGSTYNARNGSLGIQNATIDIWGVQMESGSIATPFQTATGTKQGELAACQRYYYRTGGSVPYEGYALGMGKSTTQAEFQIKYPVTMRTYPTVIESSTLATFDGTNVTAVTALAIDTNGKDISRLLATVASGLTQFRPYELIANNSTNSYIAFNSEL